MNLPHLTIVSTFKTARNTIVFIEGNYIINIPNYSNKHNVIRINDQIKIPIRQCLQIISNYNRYFRALLMFVGTKRKISAVQSNLNANQRRKPVLTFVLTPRCFHYNTCIFSTGTFPIFKL